MSLGSVCSAGAAAADILQIRKCLWLALLVRYDASQPASQPASKQIGRKSLIEVTENLLLGHV